VGPDKEVVKPKSKARGLLSKKEPAGEEEGESSKKKGAENVKDAPVPATATT
jgi:hypothetical protein